MESGVCLQLDVSHKVIQTTTVYELMKDVQMACRSQRGGRDDGGTAPPSVLNEMKRAVVGEVVMTRYNNMCYRVDDIDRNVTPRTTFDCRGREIS